MCFRSHASSHRMVGEPYGRLCAGSNGAAAASRNLLERIPVDPCFMQTPCRGVCQARAWSIVDDRKPSPPHWTVGSAPCTFLRSANSQHDREAERIPGGGEGLRTLGWGGPCYGIGWGGMGVQGVGRTWGGVASWRWAWRKCIAVLYPYRGNRRLLYRAVCIDPKSSNQSSTY